MENNGPKIASGDMAPGFKVELLLKDLNIAAESASELGLPLRGAALVGEYLRSLVADGNGELGTQALCKALEKLGSFGFSESKRVWRLQGKREERE